MTDDDYVQVATIARQMSPGAASSSLVATLDRLDALEIAMAAPVASNPDRTKSIFERRSKRRDRDRDWQIIPGPPKTTRKFPVYRHTRVAAVALNVYQPALYSFHAKYDPPYDAALIVGHLVFDGKLTVGGPAYGDDRLVVYDAGQSLSVTSNALDLIRLATDGEHPLITWEPNLTWGTKL